MPQPAFFFLFWHLSKLTGVLTMNYAASLGTGKDIINVQKYEGKMVRAEQKMIDCVAHLLQVFD